MSNKQPKLLINVLRAGTEEEHRGTIEEVKKLFKSLPLENNGTSFTSNIDVFVKDLSTMFYIISTCKQEKIALNFIGDFFNFKGESKSTEMLLALMDYIGGQDNFFLTEKGEDGVIKIRQIITRNKRAVIQVNTNYGIPEDALSGFEFIDVEGRNDVITAILGHSPCKWLTAQDGTLVIEHITRFIVLENGSQPDTTAWVNRLQQMFGNVIYRTQLTGTEIQFVRFTPSEDLYMRKWTLANSNDPYSDKTKLIKEGLVAFDPTLTDPDGDAGGYVLTTLGKLYKANNSSRVSVSEGIAIEDVVVDLRDNTYHIVKDFDPVSGMYLLCSSDYKATRLDILNNTTHFKALEVEKENFLASMA